MAPKAFISHASEDKDRFVRSFATSLLKLGVDVWFDEWEMQPGDSLVDRVFEEGIKTADAFIVILSSRSVDKPWVREELNFAVIKRITEQYKLIPVVIEECEIPECLKSTVWLRLKTLDDIDVSTKKIANAIHGIDEKPPLGPPPRHTSTAIDVFQDLNRQDQIVLKLACEQSMDTDWPQVDFPKLRSLLYEQGLTNEEIIESLKILEENDLVSVKWSIGGGLLRFDIALSAFEDYLNATQADYPTMIKTVCLQILNHNSKTNNAIQRATTYSPRVVNHIMLLLESRGLLKIHGAMGGGILIKEVSPLLARKLRD